MSTTTAYWLVPACALFAACGGGASAPAAGPTQAAPATTAPAAEPTASPNAGYRIAGTILAIPPDAFAPVTVGGTTYAPADVTTAPLAGAQVIAGPEPVTGATPPAQLPTGDVAVTTDAAGTFALSLDVAPAAPASSAPLVVPSGDPVALTLPASGYYVSVFGAGSDGQSAGAPLPLHRFAGVSAALRLRVSSATAAEAAALAAINADRAALGAGPLVFDQSAEDAARMHASDEAASGYTCHYDTHEVGPASRYLAAGGLGLTGEGLSLAYGPTAAAAFAANEAAVLAEGGNVPPGAHFANLIDPSHAWAGVAAEPSVIAPGFFQVDVELVTPGGHSTVIAPAGYPVTSGCPAGTSANAS